MDAKKRKALEAAGFKVGDAKQFLGLSEAEDRYVELKLSLARTLADKRKELEASQNAVAKALKSSQSRVAKMEAADSTVSIDLLIRALLRLGVSKRELAKAIGV